MDPTNLFAMKGENMAFAAELAADGKEPAKRTILRYNDKENTNAKYSSKTPTPQTGFSSKHW